MILKLCLRILIHSPPLIIPCLFALPTALVSLILLFACLLEMLSRITPLFQPGYTDLPFSPCRCCHILSCNFSNSRGYHNDAYPCLRAWSISIVDLCFAPIDPLVVSSNIRSSGSVDMPFYPSAILFADFTGLIGNNLL